MAEGRRIDSRVCLRKTLATAAALAAVCGAAVAMRWGVRAAVASSGFVGGSDASAPAEPDYADAPREHDLAALVPEDLRVNAGGIAVRRDVRILRMPFEQAVEIGAAEAEAAGWEPFALPLTTRFANEIRGGEVYIRPDRTIVCRSFAALRDGTTRREDFELPLGDLAEIQRDLTLDEIAARRGDLVAQQMPAILRDVIPGRLLYTQLTPHRAGAGFLVLALSTFDPGAVRLDAAKRLRAHGWTRDEANAPGVWRRGNLTAVYDIGDRGDGLGTFAIVRFADDDVIIKQTQKEKTK